MLLKELKKKIGKTNRLRRLCWCVTGAGALTSIWANALHAVLMGPVGKAISMLPPLLFVLAFEVGSRVPIPKEAAWFLRWGRLIGILGVAGIGAWLSYFHQRDAFFNYTDGDVATARMLPLSIDGLVLATAATLYVLNAKLEELKDLLALEEAKLEARKSKESEQPAPVIRQSSKITKKDQVALLLARDPELTATELATIAGISYNYAYNLMAELRKANSAELVTAS